MSVSKSENLVSVDCELIIETTAFFVADPRFILFLLPYHWDGNFSLKNEHVLYRYARSPETDVHS